MLRADFTEDGVPDLLVVSSDGGRSLFRLAPGNEDYRYPKKREGPARPRGMQEESYPWPFLPFQTVFEAVGSAEFAATGDFNADGHKDLLFASKSDARLLWVAGNGAGQFGNARSIEVSGVPTFVGVSEVGLRDGLEDLLVGLETAASFQFLIFQSPEGAANASPLMVNLSEPVVAAISLDLNADNAFDVAIASGSELTLLGMLGQCMESNTALGLDRRNLVFDSPILDLTLGDFTASEGRELAVLTEDGWIQMLHDPSRGLEPAVLSRRSWGTTPLSSGAWLAAGRVTGFPYQDLLVFDQTGDIEIFAGRPETWAGSGIDPAQDARRPRIRYQVESEPTVARPLLGQFNRDGLTDVLQLTVGTDPVVVFQTAPIDTITVNDSRARTDGNLFDEVCDAFLEEDFPGEVGDQCTLPAAFAHANRIALDDDQQPLPGQIEINFSVSNASGSGSSSRSIFLNGGGGVTIEVFNCQAFDESGNCIDDRAGGLGIGGPGSLLRGISVNARVFPGQAGQLMGVSGADSVIEGSTFGSGGMGTTGFPNCLGLALNGDGIRLGGTVEAARNFVYGQCPMVTVNGNDVEILGNYIGLDPSGNNPFADADADFNVGGGISVHPVGSLGGLGQRAKIGGTEAGAGNVIAGVSIPLQLRSEGALVQGNLIGTDPTGMITDPDGDGPVIGLGGQNGLSIEEAAFNLVGGSSPAARNIIAGSQGSNVLILEQKLLEDVATRCNRVQGNFIGVNREGTAAFPTTDPRYSFARGVSIDRASENLIGGDTKVLGNLISGHPTQGVYVSIGAANVIRNNKIGTGLDGVTPISFNQAPGDPVSNGDQGVLIAASSFTGPSIANVIAQNVIAYSAGNGVRVSSSRDVHSVQNQITENSIFENGELGIDLAEGFFGIPAVTSNDEGDADIGANNLQNFPELTAVSETRVIGSLRGNPSAEFRLEFFENTACDASGFGEGSVFIQALQLATDEFGHANFDVSFSKARNFITATATDAEGNTSEFSRCAVAGEVSADLVLAVSDSPDPVMAGQPVTYALTANNRGPVEVPNAQLTILAPDFLILQASSGCSEDPQATHVCSLGSLAPGENREISFEYQVSELADSDIIFLATLGSPLPEAAPGDESVAELTRVLQLVSIADLRLEKTLPDGPLISGLEAQYRFTVTNDGPNMATGIRVIDVLPEGLTFLQGAGCSDLIGTVTCDLGSLPPDISTMLTMTVEVSSRLSGEVTNSATVAAQELDENLEDNSASLTVPVILRGDLNDDNVLDGRDAFDLVQELNDGDGEAVEDVGRGSFVGDPDFDVNGDGTIENADLILLASLLLEKSLDSHEDAEQETLGNASPPASLLDFPRLSFAEDRLTGLAVANPGSQTATLQFTAFDQNGRVLAEAERTIPPGQQFAELTFELFGTLDPALSGWFRARSQTPGLTGFFLDLDSTLRGLDGADLPAKARRVIFNKIQIDNGFSTELSLVNTGAHETTVKLSLIGGPSPIAATLRLPPLGFKRLDVASFVEAGLPAGMVSVPRGSYLLAEAGQPLIGFEVITSDTGDFEALNARSALDLLNTIYIPQMATLGPFESSVGLVNYSQQDVVVTLTAHQGDGTLFVPQSGENPATRALGPGESLVEDVATLFGFEGDTALEGWLEIVSTSQAVNGYFSYRLPATGAAAAVAAISQPRRSAIFSHLATTSGFFTGVALLNPGAFPASFQMTVASPDGTILGSFFGVLRPGERSSRLVTDLIEASANQNGGFIFLRSNVPLLLSALFGTSDVRVLANIPPQPVPTTFQPDLGILQGRITPPISVLQPGNQIQFLTQNLEGKVIWRINGEANGDSTAGQIDATGLYTAPDQQPSDLPVSVTAETSSQVASASVDVISPKALLQGLGVVQSMTYLDSVAKLFSAELAVQAPLSGPVPSGAVETQIFANDLDERDLLLTLPNEDIRKLLPFEAGDGSEYLLALAALSGQVLRIDPSRGQMDAVVQGLHAPDTMVIDPQRRDLFVATDEEIIQIEYEQLESGLNTASLAAQPNPSQDLQIGLISEVDGVTGIALDNCTDNIFLAQAAAGRILSLSPRDGELTVVLEGLVSPNEMLVTHRRNLACPESTNLLFIEEDADRISLYIPAREFLIESWLEVPDPSDLTLAPTSDFGEGLALLIERGRISSDILAIDVSDIFEEIAENPPLALPAAFSTGPPGPDLAVGVSSAEAGGQVTVDVFLRSGGTEAGILVLTLDYDEDVLELAGGSLADSVSANLPAGLEVIAFHDPASTDRELGFLILDASSPFETLPEGNILRISFAIDANVKGSADIWITTPGPQLVNLTGDLITLDEVANGGVQIRQ